VKSGSITLTKSRRKELEALKTRPIDLSDPDAPEITDWRVAERGQFYRPIKQQITLRLDMDIVAWFKAQGGKYQSHINAALRDYIRQQVEDEYR
jgi:uncharacterized protein (DUF4415 family)